MPPLPKDYTVMTKRERMYSFSIVTSLFFIWVSSGVRGMDRWRLTLCLSAPTTSRDSRTGQSIGERSSLYSTAVLKALSFQAVGRSQCPLYVLGRCPCQASLTSPALVLGIFNLTKAESTLLQFAYFVCTCLRGSRDLCGGRNFNILP
jgi:hypothetical protein